MGVNRKYILLAIDLFWVSLSPFVALLIRDQFAPRSDAVTATIFYTGLSLVLAAVIFPLAGLNRTLWRYTSLAELLRLQVAVTATILLALLAVFAHSRLLDISRSLPLLQWFFLVAAMTGTRLLIRFSNERSDGAPHQPAWRIETEHVLVIGVNPLAEVYVRALTQFAARKLSIVGFLAKGVQMPGRLLRSYKVLGAPEELSKVVRELEVHGTWLDRIVIAEDAKELSSEARQALLDLDGSSDIKVDWLPELLGFGPSDQSTRSKEDSEPAKPENGTLLSPGRRHRYPKRLFDAFTAGILLIVTAPLFVIIGPLIALDVGLPVVFWQHRPGCLGRYFKLYKFRTMRAPHDEYGNRIPDQKRLSKFGAFVRDSRLDELPQLYNILIGEMSFVGPRPLVITDHEPGTQDRLLVRPGLTGWAQVNGGRKLSSEDKAALDLWYVANLSLRLDFRIALRTVLLIFFGERVNEEAVRAAHALRPIGNPATAATHPRPAAVMTTIQSAA